MRVTLLLFCGTLLSACAPQAVNTNQELSPLEEAHIASQTLTPLTRYELAHGVRRPTYLEAQAAARGLRSPHPAMSSTGGSTYCKGAISVYESLNGRCFGTDTEISAVDYERMK